MRYLSNGESEEYPGTIRPEYGHTEEAQTQCHQDTPDPTTRLPGLLSSHIVVATITWNEFLYSKSLQLYTVRGSGMFACISCPRSSNPPVALPHTDLLESAKNSLSPAIGAKRSRDQTYPSPHDSPAVHGSKKRIKSASPPSRVYGDTQHRYRGFYNEPPSPLVKGYHNPSIDREEERRREMEELAINRFK
ncbi:hypothetical protein BJ508DRAFT_418419 [Ascobolus immersus RN42]|uniref:Uncharacterized protein n=1 Tax=Ascobolus immersus RN42 TaxID=1160509 RepID=A0A3N4HNI1_ASCIM|nr:hypothetical protein BJ508DRAFT_418419 [Ascobolus immersus RN42]